MNTLPGLLHIAMMKSEDSFEEFTVSFHHILVLIEGLGPVSTVLIGRTCCMKMILEQKCNKYCTMTS